jgi:hypothetical protein
MPNKNFRTKRRWVKQGRQTGIVEFTSNSGAKPKIVTESGTITVPGIQATVTHSRKLSHTEPGTKSVAKTKPRVEVDMDFKDQD